LSASHRDRWSGRFRRPGRRRRRPPVDHGRLPAPVHGGADAGWSVAGCTPCREVSNRTPRRC